MDNPGLSSANPVDMNYIMRKSQTRVWKALKGEPEFILSVAETQDILNKSASSKMNFVILNVDLVASTKLSMTLPLDKLTMMIQSFNQEMSLIIKDFGGFVLKYVGDAVIDFVNATKSVEADMQFLRRRAKLVLVGLFGGELRLSLVSMPTRAYKIIGSYTGSLQDMVELVSLAKRGVIRPVVSNRFKLDQAGEALQMLKDGKIIGRGVINP